MQYTNKCLQTLFTGATLSDISNPDGRTVNHHFLEGTKPISPSSTLRWPYQPSPSPKAWILWRKTLRKIFNIQKDNSIQHHQHLAQWIVPYSLRQMKHKWNYSTKQTEVYEIKNNETYRYFTVKHDRFTFKLNLDSKERCFKIPQDSIPISCIKNNYFFLHQDFAQSTPSPNNLHSFQQHISTIPR